MKTVALVVVAGVALFVGWFAYNLARIYDQAMSTIGRSE